MEKRSLIRKIIIIIVTFIFVVFVLTCEATGPLEKYAENYAKERLDKDPNSNQRIKDEETRQLLYVLGIPNYLKLAAPNYCRSYSGVPNIAFFTGAYGESFLADKKNYRILIIGDSTMDINTKYPNWINKNKTQSLAVSGNTMCDMIEQTKVINSSNPDYIIISTNGGNDLLRGLTETEVLTNAGILHVLLKEKFPSSKQVWIGIHPTITEGNKIKNRINDVVTMYVLASHNYYINPSFLFHNVCPTCKPPQSMMIDNIHYNALIAYQLKAAIEFTIGEPL